MYENKAEEQGFVALVVVIVITAALLVISATISSTGYAGRFSVLGYENKRQATALAEGCVDYARLLLLQNSDYQPPSGGELAGLSTGSCKICAVAGTGTSRELVTRSKVGDATSNMEAEVTLEDDDVVLDAVREEPDYLDVSCPL